MTVKREVFKMSKTDCHLFKVSKSRKQIMASWILPKNERWDNFQYRKIPSFHFLEESRTPYFFSAFKVKHIFIRAYHTFHSKVNLISYAPDKNPTTGVMLLLARAQVGILHFNSE